MVNPSDSTQPTHSTPDNSSTAADQPTAEQMLRRGVAALKARHYEEALALFDGLGQASPAQRTKAQMGKVQVYQKQGNVLLARQHCQSLLTHPSPKVQQWAQNILTKLPPLEAAPPDQAQLPHTVAPAPEVNAELPADRKAPQEEDAGDRTGFVPLEPPADQVHGQPSPASKFPNADLPDQAADPQTGFTPLEDAAPIPQGHASQIEDAPEDVSPMGGIHSSLFHYQELNQQTGTRPDDFAIPPADSLATPEGVTAAPETTPGEPSRGKTTQPQLPVPPTNRRVAKPKPYRLWAIQALTALVGLWLIHWGLHHSLQGINAAIRFVLRWPFRLQGIEAFDRPHLSLVIGAGVVVILASPWILDRLLGWWYQQKRLSSRTLQQHHTEVLRLLRRVCRQRQWQLPELRLIPNDVPICFSYGWSPRTVRMVVSQGLLDTLTDEELSALYAYELTHVASWDLPVLSGLGVLLCLFYSGYWHLARWGDNRQNRWFRWGSGVVASLLYGLFWLLRKIGLWLSRQRGEYCDRAVLALWPYPEQYQQILLTLTRHISADVKNRGYLHPLLASFDLLMPLSPQQAISPGSFVDQVGVFRLVAEDCLNPYRYWLIANNSHAILGERLLGFERWAQQWHIPALGLSLEQLMAVQTAAPFASATLVSAGPDQSPRPGQPSTIQDLIFQNSPLIGLIVGGGMALGLWFLGGVVNRFNWQQLSWLYQDDSILQGGLLIGLGMGILMRVNRLFSERPPLVVDASNLQAALFQRPPTLPVNGDPMTLQGTLLGSTGMANGLSQTLYLLKDQGTVQLKFASPLDWWRGITSSSQHPSTWIGRQVTVLGWLRRAGGQLWLDVSSLQVAGQPPYRVHTPQWTTGLGLVLCVWGIWTILAGG